MCATCRWFELAAAVTANLETRDRSKQSTLVLEMARNQLIAEQHARPEMRDAIEAMAEKEGWTVA